MTPIPLVSAIMPTRARTDMARAAVRMFREQNWSNKELVILDEDQSPSFNEFAQGSNPGGIFYGVASSKLTIGEKRNIAIFNSRGQIVIHWDSDDIYRMDRMTDQVTRLMQEREAELSAYHSMEFVDEERQERWLYDASGGNQGVAFPGHAVGVSMCYWRWSWEQRRFKHLDEQEDTDFGVGRRIVSAPADGRIVARIHSGNSVDKRLIISRRKNDAQWRPLPWDQKRSVAA